MKILMVSNTMRIDGGVETSMAAVANELFRLGHQIYFVSLSGTSLLTSRLDIPAENILHLQDKGIVSRIRQLRKIIRVYNFDIVHTQLFESGLVGRVAALNLSTATVFTEQSTFFPRWKFYHYLVDYFLARRTDVLVAVSRSVAATLAARTGITPTRIFIIPNAVDTRRFKKSSKDSIVKENREVKNILLVGRLEHVKNIELAMATMKILNKSHIRAVLNVVGSGSMETQLKKWNVENGTAPFVRFLGARSDVPELMKAADVLFLPSHWEGCPMVILEAFAIGLPVVATRVPGIVDIVDNRVNGLLTQPNDPTETAFSLEEVLFDETISKTLIKHASKEVRAYEIEAVVPKLLQCYEVAITRHKRIG